MPEKEDVHIEHRTFDGELISTSVQHRLVYRPRNTLPYIKSMGGKKYLDSDAPATVVWKPSGPSFDASFDIQILNPIREAVARGEVQGVKVIGLL